MKSLQKGVTSENSKIFVSENRKKRSKSFTMPFPTDEQYRSRLEFKAVPGLESVHANYISRTINLHISLYFSLSYLYNPFKHSV